MSVLAQSSTNIDQLAVALVKCQQQLKVAVKDSTNPFFKSKYADLGSVWDACREALTANGLAVIQFPGYANGAAELTTVLLHSSGQWIQGTAGAPLKQPDAQGVGSTLTYLRRYALAAVVGVVTEDDDGEAAVRTKKQERGGTSTAPVKGEAAPASGPAAPTSPQRITPDEEFPTRDTKWTGGGAVQGKCVREWALNQLRAVESGQAPVPDEWLAIVKLELKARSNKAAMDRASMPTK